MWLSCQSCLNTGLSHMLDLTVFTKENIYAKKKKRKKEKKKTA